MRNVPNDDLPPILMTGISPEAVLVLRSVSSFETLYLTRSTSRINDAVNSAINNYISSKASLGPGEGVNIARVITNELDSAKFDPLLVRTVARNGVKVLDALVSRLDGMVSSQPAVSGKPDRSDCSRLYGDLAHWSSSYRCGKRQRPIC